MLSQHTFKQYLELHKFPHDGVHAPRAVAGRLVIEWGHADFNINKCIPIALKYICYENAMNHKWIGLPRKSIRQLDEFWN